MSEHDPGSARPPERLPSQQKIPRSAGDKILLAIVKFISAIALLFLLVVVGLVVFIVFVGFSCSY